MRLWFRPSLRSVLTAQAGMVIFLAVFICAASLFYFSVEEDREDLDASLLRQSKIIAKILSGTASTPEKNILIETVLSSNPDHRMAEIRDAAGKISRHSTHSPTPLLLEAHLPVPTAPSFRSATIGARAHRLVIFPFQQGIIALSARQESFRETLHHVFLLYGVLTFILLLIILTGGRLLADHALAPIVEMARATEGITSAEIGQRLPMGQADRELHRLAAVLNEMLERLQASFSLIRRFTADAAHELKTPLAIIQGHLESTLHQESFSPKQEATLLLTLREVERLNRLVEGLLLLSRSDAGRLDLVIEPVDWTLLTAELLHDADILCAPLALEIHSRIEPGIFVPADRQALRQVMLNLLDNASKYNRVGGSIRISLQSDNGSVRWEIANTGPGIPAQTIPHLFERFQRGEASRTRTAGSGLGLGLSICREIARAHGGEIQLVAAGSEWTVFALTLFKANA